MAGVQFATALTLLFISQVYKEVDNCCRALSERLEDQPYFFGSRSGLEIHFKDKFRFSDGHQDSLT